MRLHSRPGLSASDRMHLQPFVQSVSWIPNLLARAHWNPGYQICWLGLAVGILETKICWLGLAVGILDAKSVGLGPLVFWIPNLLAGWGPLVIFCLGMAVGILDAKSVACGPWAGRWYPGYQWSPRFGIQDTNGQPQSYSGHQWSQPTDLVSRCRTFFMTQSKFKNHSHQLCLNYFSFKKDSKRPIHVCAGGSSAGHLHLLATGFAVLDSFAQQGWQTWATARTFFDALKFALPSATRSFQSRSCNTRAGRLGGRREWFLTLRTFRRGDHH